MARIYFDTGALVKLYIVEHGSEFVQQKACTASSIPLVELQETELRNAIHAAVGRKTITAAAGALALGHLETDIRTGVLATTPTYWPPPGPAPRTSHGITRPESSAAPSTSCMWPAPKPAAATWWSQGMNANTGCAKPSDFPSPVCLRGIDSLRPSQTACGTTFRRACRCRIDS